MGLSTLVHIGVIVFNWLFQWYPRKHKHQKNSGKTGRVFSFAIIAIVFIFGVMNAGILLSASINDRHSTTIVVGSLIRKAVAYSHKYRITFVTKVHSFNNGQTLSSEQVATTTDVSLSGILPTISCQKSFSELEETYDGSVVDYLNANFVNSSYDDREVLAHELGISDYNGMYEDNKLLFLKLFIKNSKLQVSDTACEV